MLQNVAFVNLNGSTKYFSESIVPRMVEPVSVGRKPLTFKQIVNF